MKQKTAQGPPNPTQGIKEGFTGIANWLLTLSPLEFTVFATTLGLILSEGLEQRLSERLGVFLSNAAFAMITYSSQRDFLRSQLETTGIDEHFQTIMQMIQQLQNEIAKLKLSKSSQGKTDK